MFSEDKVKEDMVLLRFGLTPKFSQLIHESRAVKSAENKIFQNLAIVMNVYIIQGTQTCMKIINIWLIIYHWPS
jgi:hypothetical protein